MPWSDSELQIKNALLARRLHHLNRTPSAALSTQFLV